MTRRASSGVAARRAARGGAAALALLLAAAPAARAGAGDEAAGEAGDGAPGADEPPGTREGGHAGDDHGEGTGKRKGKGRPKGGHDGKGDDDDPLAPYSLAGRVFALAEARAPDGEPWVGQLDLASARLAVGYAWKQRVRLKVSVEAAGGVAVRDAFVEITERPVAVRAGRFRVPISAVQQASAWTLPSVERGAVAAVLEDGLALTGRRDGAQAAWAATPALALTLAATQSVAITGDAPARPLGDGAGVAVTARAELAPARGVRVAATAGVREVNYVADVRRYWAGSAELALDLADHGVPLRLWADAVAGSGHLAVVTGSDPSSTFVAAQAIAGWRFGGRKRGRAYVEPFARGAVLDPSRATTRDVVTDVAVGVAGGAWKRWRLQGQLTRVDAQGQRPAGLLGLGGDVDDELRLAVQLGAAF